GSPEEFHCFVLDSSGEGRGADFTTGFGIAEIFRLTRDRMKLAYTDRQRRRGAAMEPSLVVFPQSGIDSDQAPGRGDWPDASRLQRAAAECQGHPGPILRALEQAEEALPVPGAGATKQLWEFFASIAAVDLVAARTLEPHFDAAAILQQASMPWPAAS